MLRHRHKFGTKSKEISKKGAAPPALMMADGGGIKGLRGNDCEYIYPPQKVREKQSIKEEMPLSQKQTTDCD